MIKKLLFVMTLLLLPTYGVSATYQPIFGDSVREACSRYQSWNREVDNYLCQGFQLIAIKKNLPSWFERIFGKEQGIQLAKTVLDDSAWKQVVAEIDSEANDIALPISERIQKKTQLKAMLLERIFTFATAKLPMPNYPEAVIKACEDKTAKDTKIKCLDSLLQFNMRELEQTYTKLLKDQGLFSSFRSGQKDWLIEMQTGCNFNNALGEATLSAELQCRIGWIRLRKFELSEEMKKESS